MFIVMHCGGLPFNGETIFTESLGGSETAAYYMAKELAALGHVVTLFTNTNNGGIYDGVKYLPAGEITKNCPLGKDFHFYATNTPHDVLIIQRHPQAFEFNWASKINLWWCHDLATVRMRDAAVSQLWNVDRILVVSEFHKKQMMEVWGVSADAIHVIRNGIDLDLFNGELSEWGEKINSFIKNDHPELFTMMYSSRPERGLENLVKPNGIMERLAKISSKFHLYVCGYQNPHKNSSSVDNYTYGRCEELPNVTLLGQLPKKELADLMRSVDLMVYPIPGPAQPNFEEVSCITMMECMAAGLPAITSHHGALPETCKDSGVTLLPLNDGAADIGEFVNEIVKFQSNQDLIESESSKQLFAANKYTWSRSASELAHNLLDELFGRKSTGAMARHMIRMSDIKLMDAFTYDPYNEICNAAYTELDECYEFRNYESLEEYYHDKHTRYAQEKGIEYGPQSMDGNLRFEYVSGIIGGLLPGASVLDYGCAHGHFTINLAKRFPDKVFIGVDISSSNVEKARKWAASEGIANVEFYCGSVKDGRLDVTRANDDPLNPDAVIAAEVMEHSLNPGELIDTLNDLMKDNGKMIITTPTGPWEDMAYEDHWYAREHLYHFEREDLHDMFGHADEFEITMCSQQANHQGMILGSYVTVFNRMTDQKTQPVNNARKLFQMVPRETVSLCMIVKDAEQDIKKCIKSVYSVADEIVIGIDQTTSDHTIRSINEFLDSGKKHFSVRIFPIESPLDIGFDEARNTVINEATGDWILWLDSDEVLVNSENLFKYLRRNMFDGYSIPQHHFASEPAGILRTDIPCKIFRNGKGIKFRGVVHEHPEAEINKGPGQVRVIHDVSITHLGYSTEAVRRNRFERNIGLMIRDREKHPERILGKFLYMRDLTMLCEYELELSRGRLSHTILNRAKEAISLWEELVETKNIRIIKDSLEHYSKAVALTGEGFEGCLHIDSSLFGNVSNDIKPIVSMFQSVDHFKRVADILIDHNTQEYNSRYL